MDRKMIVDDVSGFFFFVFFLSLSLSSIRSRSLFLLTLVLSFGLLLVDSGIHANIPIHTH
jgi:hypothetical protein